MNESYTATTFTEKSIALDVFIMSLHYLKNEEGMKRVLDYTLVNEQFVILP